jgi:hypothetical protein
MNQAEQENKEPAREKWKTDVEEERKAERGKRAVFVDVGEKQRGGLCRALPNPAGAKPGGADTTL